MILRMISSVVAFLFVVFVLARPDVCVGSNGQRPRYEEDVDAIFETEYETSSTSSTSSIATRVSTETTDRNHSNWAAEVSTTAPVIREPTNAPTIQVNVEDFISETVEDDDYTVVVLDDAIPWDLTSDTPDDDYSVVVLDDAIPWDLTEEYTADVPNEQLSKNEGLTASPTPVPPPDDDDDYVVLILEDDVPWDDVALTEYVKDEFEALNNANSNITQETDDGYNGESQDALPTAMPTAVMNPTASPKPTQLESLNSTVAPTVSPSGIPSDYPSYLPTESPSHQPSASPTISCHDEESYRSPINDLTCAQHKDTNCLNWRHLGLNMTELETLVSSCPITCNIECGSFRLFSAPVSFRISRVAGFMDPKDVTALTDFSIEFLEDFVRKYIAQNKNAWIERNNPEDESESNDNDEESQMEDSDDFFNEDALDGRAITFEIEVAELTAQNLVEDNPIVIGRTEVSGDDQNDDVRRERFLRTGSLEDIVRTKQQSSGGKSIINTNEALDIIITFGGFTIGLNPEKMSELLVSGIEGVEFTRELQQSRIDFFSDATVSSATETTKEDFVVEEDIAEDDIEENSTVSVLISYLVPVIVIGFAIGSLFYHRCYVKGRWTSRHTVHRQNAIERAQIGGMTATPISATTGNNIVTSSSGDEGSASYFNFRRHGPTNFNSADDDETTTTKKSNQVENTESGKMVVGHSAFTRLVTAFNFKLANLALTQSKNSTDEEENKVTDDASNTSSNNSNDDDDEVVPRDRIPIITDDLVSPMSGDSEKNEASPFDGQQFKPYTSVLPPMIVIDNIDGSDNTAMSPVMMATDSLTTNSSRMPDPSIRSSSTPLEDLDAFASEFRKQLSRSSKNAINPRNASYSGSIYGMNSSSALDLRSSQGSLFGPNAEDEDDRMIKGMVSEDWDGDDLFSPIPSNITTNDGEGEHEDDLLPNTEDTSSSGDSGGNQEAPSTTVMSTPIDTARKSRNFGTWDGIPSSSMSIANLDAKFSSSSSSMPVVMHRGTKSDGLPPKRPPTPERANTGARPIVIEHQHRRASFPKITPIVQPLVGDSSTRSLGEGHRRKSSTDTAPDLPKNSSSISALSTDDLVIGSSKSDGSHSNINRLEFEAPRKGNWGLVLESSSKTGPKIYAVKDYSPLFGLVQKGDKLLEIDGKNVSQSNLTDVTKLLKGKSSSYPYHRPTSSTMPIVVSRNTNISIDSSAAHGSKDLNHRYTQLGEYNHKRTNSYSSYGSAGSSGSRVVEDVDDDNNNSSAVYYLDHHQQQQMNQHSSFEYDSSNEI